MKLLPLIIFSTLMYPQYIYGCSIAKGFLENFDISELHFKGLIKQDKTTRILIKHPIIKNENLSLESSLGTYPATVSDLIGKHQSYIIEISNDYITIATPYNIMKKPDFSTAMGLNEFKALSKEKMSSPVLVSCKQFPPKYLTESPCPYFQCENAAYVQRLFRSTGSE